MGRHLPTRTRRPWLFSFSLTTIVVAPPLRTTRRECGRGRSATRGDSSSSSPPGPGYRRLENRLTLSSIHCSPLCVHCSSNVHSSPSVSLGGGRPILSPCPFRLSESSVAHIPHAYGTYIISEFLHYVYNYNTLWGWWGSGGGNPRTNGREGGKLLCKQLPFYFCEYFEGLGFSTRTLGHYARGARPISYVPKEIFLFYKM